MFDSALWRGTGDLRQLLALHRHSGLRSKWSGLRDEADVERTCSELPCLTRSRLSAPMAVLGQAAPVG